MTTPYDRSTPFDGPVPPPEQPNPVVLSGLEFQHPLEQFGAPNLTAIIALEVVSSTPTDV